MIRTLLFDLGNVLVHFSHERMCTQMGALCDRRGAEIHRLLFETGLQLEFERGALSEEEFHQRFELAVGADVSFEQLLQAGSDIFELNEPMPAILDALRAQGHRLVLLSNTSSAHFRFVERTFDVLDRFDAHVVSYRVGAVKPEPAIFEAALEQIDCAPGECFYTDDIAAYVETGRKYGLQAEVFTDPASLCRQLAARGLTVTSGRSPESGE